MPRYDRARQLSLAPAAEDVLARADQWLASVELGRRRMTLAQHQQQGAVARDLKTSARELALTWPKSSPMRLRLGRTAAALATATVRLEDQLCRAFPGERSPYYGDPQ